MTAGAFGIEPFEDAVDVPVLVALAELVEDLLGVRSTEVERQADLGHGLDQLQQRLADAGEGLVEIRRDLRQVLALGARGEARGRPGRVDLLEGLLDRRLVRP